MVVVNHVDLRTHGVKLLNEKMVTKECQKIITSSEGHGIDGIDVVLLFEFGAVFSDCYNARCGLCVAQV